MQKFKVRDYLELLQENELVTSFILPSELLEQEINSISYNSKQVISNTLFVCKGLGYKKEYLEEAIQKGAILYLSEHKEESQSDFPHIIVSDVRTALAVITCMYYNYPAKRINIIGITGTKGKSTTAYYIKSILDYYLKQQHQKDTAIISSIDTYDGVSREKSKLTCPESLELQNHIKNAVDSNMPYLVMEVSSQALKFSRTHGILYDVGIFTNISEDHISPTEHPDFEDYFSNKLKFFHQVKNAIINLDSDYIGRILSEANASSSVKRIVTYSTKNNGADIMAYDIQKEGVSLLKFKLNSTFEELNGKEIVLTMPRTF